MRVNNIQTMTYQQNFEGRYWDLLTKSSGKKIMPLDRVNEEIIIRQTYNKLWEKLKTSGDMVYPLVSKSTYGGK